jgi:hypothetical protein
MLLVQGGRKAIDALITVLSTEDPLDTDDLDLLAVL